jgi:hypothetical protein
VTAARALAAAVNVLLAILPAACKSGVVPGNAYENSLDLQGALVGPLPEGAHPIATVIWTDPLQRRPDVAMPARWIDSTVATASATAAPASAVAGDGAASLAAFTLRLFRAPPSEALVEISSPDGHHVARLALGEMAIVDDADGDGTFEIDAHGTMAGPAGAGAAAPGGNRARDRYIAFSQQVLAYIERPFPADVAAGFLVASGTATGYHFFTYVCQGRLPSRTIPATAAKMEPQTSFELIQRRTCMRTHSP